MPEFEKLIRSLIQRIQVNLGLYHFRKKIFFDRKRIDTPEVRSMMTMIELVCRYHRCNRDEYR